MSAVSLSIIVPIFNEAHTLPRLLRQIQNTALELSLEMILVDAGSTDGSRDIIARFQKETDCRALYLPKQCGKGRAVRDGLRLAKGEIILIQDGDLEYSPLDYPKLVGPILTGQCDFVLGSRVLGSQTWKIRSQFNQNLYLLFLDAGAHVLTKVFCGLYRVKISDPMTMYKVFRRSQLDLADLRCEGFDFDWELLCKLIRSGGRFTEIPVSYQARTLAEGKKLRGMREGFRALRVMIQESL